MPVNTLLVRGNHLRALAAIGHDELLAVACAAGGRNVAVMHTRFRIASREQFVRTSMTVHASGGVAVAGLQGFTVEAAIIGGLLVGMAGRAADFLRSGFVRGSFYVGMAIHTGEHAAVDRVFERLRIDVQADRLALHFMSEGGITVACEALVRGRFGRIFLGCSVQDSRG